MAFEPIFGLGLPSRPMWLIQCRRCRRVSVLTDQTEVRLRERAQPATGEFLHDVVARAKGYLRCSRCGATDPLVKAPERPATIGSQVALALVLLALVVYGVGCAVMNERVAAACTHGNCQHGWASQYTINEQREYWLWVIGYPAGVAGITALAARAAAWGMVRRGRAKRPNA